MVKVIKTKNLGKSINDNFTQGAKMEFGLTESLPKALTVGPLFPRKASKAAKKSRIEMEKKRQEKILERTKGTVAYNLKKKGKKKQ